MFKKKQTPAPAPVVVPDNPLEVRWTMWGQNPTPCEWSSNCRSLATTVVMATHDLTHTGRGGVIIARPMCDDHATETEAIYASGPEPDRIQAVLVKFFRRGG